MDFMIATSAELLSSSGTKPTPTTPLPSAVGPRDDEERPLLRPADAGLFELPEVELERADGLLVVGLLQSTLRLRGAGRSAWPARRARRPWRRPPSSRPSGRPRRRGTRCAGPRRPRLGDRGARLLRVDPRPRRGRTPPRAGDLARVSALAAHFSPNDSHFGGGAEPRTTGGGGGAGGGGLGQPAARAERTGPARRRFRDRGGHAEPSVAEGGPLLQVESDPGGMSKPYRGENPAARVPASRRLPCPESSSTGANGRAGDYPTPLLTTMPR